ncbi:MAG: Fic family protein [Pseudomonadota bacterium]
MTIHYVTPDRWIKYDAGEIVHELIEAKAAVLALTNIPYQRAWAEALQEMELKREVAGTSKIEGADFTDREFEEAVNSDLSDTELNRSQKQARAAINTYRWLEKLDKNRPITADLIREIHRRIVTGCDDDHCAPGTLRSAGENVTFGRPRHRGAEGGLECSRAFEFLCSAIETEFRNHDPLIRAFAVHYHLGAIHPFQDGNGRTARALEALLLQKADLKDSLFIAMSNFYYDEKDTYLALLSGVAVEQHNLTQFLKFALGGLSAQCQRLLKEIRHNVAKSLYREIMGRMYGRLHSTRKRALASRQLKLLEFLLDRDEPIRLDQLFDKLSSHYAGLAEIQKAFVRDVNNLISLRAIKASRDANARYPHPWASFTIVIHLEWPMEITETEFYAEMEKMPQAKTRLLVI